MQSFAIKHEASLLITFSLSTYSRYDEIVGYAENIATNYPSFVNMSVEGNTAEGRKVLLLKIGTSPKGSETPAIFFDAGSEV